MRHLPSSIQRRHLLRMAFALGLLGLGYGRGTRASTRIEARPLDEADPISTSSGLVHAELEPHGRWLALFGIASVTLQGSPVCTTLQRLTVFTDLEDGRPIEAFKNPFNGHFCRTFAPIEEFDGKLPGGATAAHSIVRRQVPWYPWMLMQASPGGLVVEEEHRPARRWRDSTFDASVWDQFERISSAARSPDSTAASMPISRLL
jgi:hypothetical protein